MSELTCGSLFSGVGGMDIGLAWAGFRHRFLCEIDPYCQAVLTARFPGVQLYSDVRDVDESAGHVDLLTSTFPCQDISVAGKRAGLAGERSGLFHESMRVVDAVQPRAILIENVEGLYSSGSPRGTDFGVVLDSLAARGYLATWRTLDAQFFGVPQRRRRCFVVAIADGDLGAERIGEVLAVTEGSRGDSPTSDPSWPHVVPAAGGSTPGGSGADDVIRDRESRSCRHRQVGEGQRRTGRGRVPEPRVVGALSAQGYTKYTDDQMVRGGQLITSHDLPNGERERERVVSALTQSIQHGVDVRNAQAGHLIVEPISSEVSE